MTPFTIKLHININTVYVIGNLQFLYAYSWTHLIYRYSHVLPFHLHCMYICLEARLQVCCSCALAALSVECLDFLFSFSNSVYVLVLLAFFLHIAWNFDVENAVARNCKHSERERGRVRDRERERSEPNHRMVAQQSTCFNPSWWEPLQMRKLRNQITHVACACLQYA